MSNLVDKALVIADRAMLARCTKSRLTCSPTG